MRCLVLAALVLASGMLPGSRPSPASAAPSPAPPSSATTATPASTAPLDLIRFVNGDRVHGRVLWVRDGTLGFSAWASPEIRAPLAEVAAVEAEGVFEVKLSDGTLLRGPLGYAGPDAPFGVRTVAGTVPVPLRALAAFETVAEVERQALAREREQRLSLRKVWKGHLDWGFARSTGNTELQDLRVAAAATRTTKVDKLSLSAFNNVSSAGTKKTAGQSAGEARLDIFLKNDFFYFLHGRLESDDLRELDLRTTLGAGLGKTFRGAHDFRLSLGLGYSFVTEQFELRPDRKDGTLLLTLDFDRALGRRLFLEERLVAYPELSDGGLRYTSQTTLKSKLTRDLSFTVGLLNKYDSDPPAGIGRSDVTFTTGLRKDF